MKARRTKRSLPGTARVLLALIVLSAWPTSTQTPQRRRSSTGHQLPQVAGLGAARGAAGSIVRGDGTVRASIPSLARLSLLATVDQVGDPIHRFGFAYDEMDGTKLDHRPAFSSSTDASGRLSRPDPRASGRVSEPSHETRHSGPSWNGRPRSHGTAEPLGVRVRGWSGWWRTSRSGCLPSIACLALRRSGILPHHGLRDPVRRTPLGFGYHFESSTGLSSCPPSPSTSASGMTPTISSSRSGDGTVLGQPRVQGQRR